MRKTLVEQIARVLVGQPADAKLRQPSLEWWTPVALPDCGEHDD
jgi:hypothetical protein